MEDVPVMQVLESQANLAEHGENLIFCKLLATLLLSLDQIIQVSILSVLHDDVERPLILWRSLVSLVNFIKVRDVGMLADLENLGFLHGIFSLVIIQI